MEKTEQWERVKELFDAALERDPADRDRFLSCVCGTDTSLREEIDSLLAAHARSDGLSLPAIPIAAAEEVEPLDAIGPYRLIRKIGEGGMGQVWLAEQTEPLRRQVALKLIRFGEFDDARLRRFQAERQSLALMDHPAIAKVFDAGTTSGGQPYFVMEYVQGESITAYCDRKKLSIRERLELFVRVCEGVQHAHQKAIIHRDLKPANILVVEVDGEPAPRLIDFGLAKAVEPWAAGESASTIAWGIAGTPGYISPEQAAGSDIDTRTDVYSLGVILYQLLTGSLPFDAEKWRRQPLDESLRQLREEDPPSPSTRLGSDRKLAAAAAGLRASEARHLASLLHGDLDCISLKALEKDRARRYGTPSELAADITRYLNHEPVVARPANTGYRLMKYARRHRVAVSVAASLVILLTGFAVVEAVQLRRITEERDRTARERDRANRIADFATGMFKVSDPNEARGKNVTAREILDKASAQVETGLEKDPEMQARLMYFMGHTYQGLGLFQESETLFRKALAIQERIAPNGGDTARTAVDLGVTLMYDGKFAEAEQADRESLRIAQLDPGPGSSRIISAKATLASALLGQGKFDEAATLYQDVLNILQKVAGPEDSRTTAYTSNLALVYYVTERFSEAEQLERQVLAVERRTLGPDHPNTLRVLTNLSLDLTAEGQFAEAEQKARDAWEIDLRVVGPEHPLTAASMQYLANALRGEGRFAEAEKLDRDTLAVRRKIFRMDNGETVGSMDALAGVLLDEGRSVAAERLQRKALGEVSRELGPEHPDVITDSIHLAAILEREGRYSEAESAVRKVLEPARRVLGPRSLRTLQAMNTLALALAHEGKNTEAADLVKQALDIESQVQAAQHIKYAYSTYYLACIAAIQGRRDEAFSLLHKSIEKGLWPEAEQTMDRDPDLKSLHGDPRFEALAALARQNVATARKM